MPLSQTIEPVSMAAALGTLLQINPNVPDASHLQRLVAYGGAIVVGVVFLVIIRGIKTPELEGTRRANARLIQSRLASLRTKSIVIEKGEDLDEYRETIRRILRDGSAPQTTARGAFAAALGDIRSAWSARAPNIPRLSLRLAWEGILVAVFGSIAVVSIEAWRNAAESGGSFPDLAAVIEAVATVSDVFLTFLTSFPFFGTLWSFGLAYGLLLGEILYTAWLPIAVILLVGAVSVALLDRVTAPDLDTTVIENKRTVLRNIVAVLAVSWVAGVLGTTVGRYAARYTGRESLSTVGELVGLGAAVLVFLAGAGYGAVKLVRAVRHTHSSLADPIDPLFPSEGPGRHGVGLTATTIIAFKLTALVGLVSLPLLVAYVMVSITSGKILAVVGVLLSAPLTTQLPIAAAFVVLVAVLLLDNPARWGDVRAALSHAMSKQRVRAFAFARGLPTVLIALVFVFGWSFQLPVVMVLPAALIVGVVARVLWFFYSGAKYRYISHERPDTTPRRAVVDLATPPLEDSTGRTVYHGRVNGNPVAWPDEGRFIDTILRDVRSVFVSGSPHPSVESYYHEEMEDRGLTDPERVRRKYRGDIRTQIEYSIKDGDSADKETLMEELHEEYDPETVKRVFAYLTDGNEEVEGTRQVVEEEGLLRFRTGSSKSL